ncbi:MAG: hypothetical protein J0L82_18285 [Deltaproteobacteria bacterium]|jgi:hypothetical protein|nr:hypothetical protein [Deltaproteobacteria bacterium]
MIIFRLLSLVLVLIATVGAQAQDRSIYLKSREGVELTLNYFSSPQPFDGCYSCSVYTLARDLSIVASGNVKENSDITVLFKNWQKSVNSSGVKLDILELRLTKANGKLLVKLAAYTTPGGVLLPGIPIFESGQAGTTVYWQQISFVVDGVWQTDDFNGTNDFNFVMQQY